MNGFCIRFSRRFLFGNIGRRYNFGGNYPRIAKNGHKTQLLRRSLKRHQRRNHQNRCKRGRNMVYPRGQRDNSGRIYPDMLYCPDGWCIRCGHNR